MTVTVASLNAPPACVIPDSTGYGSPMEERKPDVREVEEPETDKPGGKPTSLDDGDTSQDEPAEGDGTHRGW